jgi:hypothetical protein
VYFTIMSKRRNILFGKYHNITKKAVSLLHSQHSIVTQRRKVKPVFDDQSGSSWKEHTNNNFLIQVSSPNPYWILPQSESFQLFKDYKGNKLHFYPMLSDFRNSMDIWKFQRPRPLVLLPRAMRRWGRVRCTGTITLTVKHWSTQRQPLEEWN